MSSLSNVQPSMAPVANKQSSQPPPTASAEAAAIAAPAPAPPQPRRAPDDESHVLSGIKFVLVALDPYPQLKQKVTGLISEGGGSVYPEGATLATVGSDENPYAVCPWGFPRGDQEKAAQSDLFQHGAESQAPQSEPPPDSPRMTRSLSLQRQNAPFLLPCLSPSCVAFAMQLTRSGRSPSTGWSSASNRRSSSGRRLSRCSSR